MMLGIRCVGVGVCFGAKPTQKACARGFMRPEEDDKRQGPRAVNRRKEFARVGERRRSERGGC